MQEQEIPDFQAPLPILTYMDTSEAFEELLDYNPFDFAPDEFSYDFCLDGIGRLHRA